MGSRVRSFEGFDAVALLEAVRGGNMDAYGELYQRYHRFAYKVARRLNRRQADDTVSEAFRRILTAISRGAGPTEAFGPYLATTVRSVAAGLAAPYQEVSLDVSGELLSDEGDVDPRVSTAYTSLPEQWQNALWYSDVEGMSPRHAAPLMGLPTANAFSALRKRARAGLRSAYLTLVVEDVCNDEVRRHLELLMAGKVEPDVVDQLVDEHMEQCDQCAAIAWRVAAVSGNKLGLWLAPAVLAFHGFSSAGALLPAGLGLGGILGWFARASKTTVTAVSVSAVAAVGAVAGVALGFGPFGNDGGRSGAVVVEHNNGAGGATPGVSDVPPSSTVPPSTATSTVPPTTVPLVVSLPPSTTSTSTTTVPPTTTVAATKTTSPTPTPTTVAVTTATTTVPPTTTTVPPTTTTTTVPPTTTTTTVPPTTTTTTTVPPTTTTTTVVADPSVPPIGQFGGNTRTVGQPPEQGVQVNFIISELTGAPGSLRFSRAPVELQADNAVCSGQECSFANVAAPKTIAVSARFEGLANVTITLVNEQGQVVQSAVVRTL